MVSDRTTGNPLSAGSLSLFMATALPRGDSSKLKNGTEAIALAVHAGMLAVGFRLVGLGENERIGECAAFLSLASPDTHISTKFTVLDTQTLIEAYADAENPNPLPTTWNATSLYTFRYKHAQSAMDYHINVHKLGGKAAVSAIAIGDDRPKNFDVTTKDYLSESMLPLSIPEDMSTEDAAKKLMDLFISSGRLNDLSAELKLKVIQKLAPSLQKVGYEEESGASNSQNGPTRDDNSTPRPTNPPNPRQPQDPEPARPYPFDDPLAVPRQPGRPLPEPMPGFEDEYEVHRPPRGGLRDDRYPVGIGHDDLYPQGLGPNDPLRPHLGGGLPRPGDGFGGGMHPTFDDPLFRGQGGQGGYDPSAPPGARYDPVGPGGAPRDNRGGGPRFPGGGGFGGPPNAFGGFGGNDFI
ncbi:hypothetical protein E8E12_001823 [Didymella heteroderae]|uniref:Proteasome inhibitor PI31 subunit n=1 Tax=Didymella heteroderae TaxID=1769908 RepID=A0A9P5BYJ1_9PLEO|nr:hypothetical protein E8E12_001823 [Didymella heteroderae]